MHAWDLDDDLDPQPTLVRPWRPSRRVVVLCAAVVLVAMAVRVALQLSLTGTGYCELRQRVQDNFGETTHPSGPGGGCASYVDEFLSEDGTSRSDLPPPSP